MTDLVESYLQVWRDKLITDIDKELTPADICSLFSQTVNKYVSFNKINLSIFEQLLIIHSGFARFIFQHNRHGRQQMLELRGMDWCIHKMHRPKRDRTN